MSEGTRLRGYYGKWSTVRGEEEGDLEMALAGMVIG